MFAKFDEIPSLPPQDIKEKPKCHRQRITKGNNSNRIGPSPYFSTLNVYLVAINVYANFFEILSLLFQDIEKPKRHGQTDMETVYPSTNSLRGV